MAGTDFVKRGIFTPYGTRKYLIQKERQAFIETASEANYEMALLGLILAYTGCRLSEALSLCPSHVDLGGNCIVFETLKQRRKGVFRQVPAPRHLLIRLSDLAYAKVGDNGRFWSIHRQTAWRWVQSMMAQADITGDHATSRGLRHGFAICALQADIPLNLVQKWLGHSHLATTAIYASAVGEQERHFAKRMWV